MHLATSQMSEKLGVLEAGVLEPIREDRKAVRAEVAGAEVTFLVGGLGEGADEAAVPRPDGRGDGRGAEGKGAEDVPQEVALLFSLYAIGVRLDEIVVENRVESLGNCTDSHIPGGTKRRAMFWR